MASPYDFKYEVQEADGPLKYRGECYAVGDIINVKHTDKVCFFEDVLPAKDTPCCFPEYCVGKDGASTKQYNVPVLVPAGATVEEAVASIEGCKPPAMVCFHYCSPCLYVGYDAAPVTDPADPVAQSGGGADPNPTCRDLIEKGVCVETLHIFNPTAEDVIVTLSYYC